MATTAEPVDVQRTAATVVAWSASALILLMPLHVVFLRVGIAVKPWFLPLVAGVIALVPAWQLVRRAFRRAGWILVGGMALILLSGLLGLVGADNETVAARHAAGLLLVALVAIVVAAPVQIPQLGLVLRLGAIAMAAAALIEAILLFSGWVGVSALTWESRFAEQAAEVTVAGVVVVNGLHVDSNFSALYAVAWLYLIPAYPAERWFGRIADGVVVGLLLLQLVVSASKGGFVALVAGLIVVGVGRLVSGPLRRGLGRRSMTVAGVTLLVGFVGLAAADAVDGDSELASNYDIRASQVTTEAGRFVDLLLVVLPDESPTTDDASGTGRDRAQIWRVYGGEFGAHPVLGVGYGVTAVGYSYAHNAPLEAAAGGGVLGLAGWALLVVGLAVSTVRNLRDSNAALWVAASTLVVLVGSLVLTTNYEPVLGLVIGLTVTPRVAAGPAPPGPGPTT